MPVSVYRIRLMFPEQICPICGLHNEDGINGYGYLFLCKFCDFFVGFEGNGFRSGTISAQKVYGGQEIDDELLRLVRQANKCLAGLEEIAKKGERTKRIIDNHVKSVSWTFPEPKER